MSTQTEPATRTGMGKSSVSRILVALGAALALLLLGAAAGIALSPAGSAHEPSASDVGFAQDMSLHHQQAVTMATLARERASTQEVRQLAFDIETNQRDQIGRMQGWLSLWGEPAQHPGVPMRWMRSGGEHDHGAGPMPMPGEQGRMPGMATSRELAELRSLSGPAFDAQFLKLMLRHHEGGAPMAEHVAHHASIQAVRGLASNMLGSQRAESSVMRQMLSQRGEAPLPPP